MPFLQAADVVELAMQLEKTGEAFYRAVAGKARSAPVRALFEDLAAQEVKHYQVFSELGRRVREKPLMTDDEWAQYVEYLKAMVAGAFFEGPQTALAAARGLKDEKAAARAAIGFEKETLLFFYDLRDAVGEADREFVDRVLAEEKSHIRRLAALVG